MQWVNYHSHSFYCDGLESPEDYIKAAIKKGFRAFGCSSHAPVPFNSKWNMPLNKLNIYLNEINSLKIEYQDSIQVYTGLEIDYISGFWGRNCELLKDIELDYYIGSIHYLDPMPDGTYFCFDGKPDLFFEGIKQLYKNDFRWAVKRYYQNVRDMIITDCPDIIGHIDKIKMHNHYGSYLNESEAWYIKEIDDTLDLAAEKGCMIEINTRGLYKHDPPLIYPGIEIIHKIHERNIPVVINSDSHHPSEIDSAYVKAAEMLLSAGIGTIRILDNGAWKAAEFNRNGIIF